jgi:hypothetical protein
LNDACREFRNEWPQDGAEASAHVATCASCARWVLALTRVRSAFTDLGRLAAPVELDERVALELGGDRSHRQRRMLESLVRRGAPRQLDERIAEILARASGVEAEERGARKAEALRTLDVQRAPAVLERLLNEELAAPEKARAERFSDLERLPAPDVLAERIGGLVRRRAWLRLWIAPLSAVSAAALVVWIALRPGTPEVRAYRFQVAHAATLDDLDPMARALAESLGGGAER